jgi:hypothetical protein
MSNIDDGPRSQSAASAHRFVTRRCVHERRGA